MIEQLFEWFGIDLKKFPNIQILEGSLEKSKFGLNPDEYQFLLDNVDEIIRCAAKMGVKCDSGGRLLLPIRVEKDQTCR